MPFHNFTLERQKEDKNKCFPNACHRVIGGRLFIDIDSAKQARAEVIKEIKPIIKEWYEEPHTDLNDLWQRIKGGK